MSMVYPSHIIPPNRILLLSTLRYLDWKVKKDPKGPIPISCRSRGLNILQELAVAPDNPSNARKTNSLEGQTSDVPI